MSNNKKVGEEPPHERMERRRKALGVSYRTLADEVGVSHSVLHRLLTGRPSEVRMDEEALLNRVRLALQAISIQQKEDREAGA